MMVNLKNNIWFLIVFVSLGCKQDQVVGEWLAKDRFSTVTYEVSNDDIKGLVLNVANYNDGTTVYKKGEQSPLFSELNLCKKGDVYVDCSSGATSLNKSVVNNIEIKVLNEDSLKVQKKVNNKLIIEYWKKK